MSRKVLKQTPQLTKKPSSGDDYVVKVLVDNIPHCLRVELTGEVWGDDLWQLNGKKDGTRGQ